MTALEVAALFESVAPLDFGVAGDQLGFVWGDPETPVGGVACTWCADTKSLTTCINMNLNMIVCHEALWLSPQFSQWYDGPDEAGILPNCKRRELLEEHRPVIYRSHSNWDALPGDGIADQAVAALGIDKLREVSRQKFFSVQELPTPCTIQELRNTAAEGLGYPGCRIFGDPEKRIQRFAFLIGGFGENQLHMPQAAMEMGAEAIIIGDMSEFIVIGCLEMGLPVIETLHSASEIPGIRRQAKILAERLKGLRVEYVPSGAMA